MSFINKNPYFPDLIRAELEKAGLKEIGDDGETPAKIHYCDINYGKRNHPSTKKCEIVNQLQDVNILGNKKSDDWINYLNIGNIMYLSALNYEDLDIESDPKFELLRDAVLEKVKSNLKLFF